MNHPSRPWRQILLVLPLLLVLGVGTTAASIDFDVAVGLDVNDDTRIFLNVTNQTWYPTPEAAPRLIGKCRHPGDDFPVIAFLAFHSHKSPDFILGLRAGGLTWWETIYELHVSPSVLFAGMSRDPGPPYGKAWGHWKKRAKNKPSRRHRMGDADIVNLVKIQTASRHFGVSPEEVLEAGKRVRRVETFAANRWREKNGKSKWNEKGGKKNSPGQKPSKNKGKGRNH